jgi:glutaredoxin 3
MRNVTMYTKDSCEFCERAKNLLHSYPEYVIYEINLNKEPHMKDTVKSTLGTTVPQIVIDGMHVGGYQELQEYLEQWKW